MPTNDIKTLAWSKHIPVAPPLLHYLDELGFVWDKDLGTGVIFYHEAEDWKLYILPYFTTTESYNNVEEQLRVTHFPVDRILRLNRLKALIDPTAIRTRVYTLNHTGTYLSPETHRHLLELDFVRDGSDYYCAAERWRLRVSPYMERWSVREYEAGEYDDNVEKVTRGKGFPVDRILRLKRLRALLT